MRRGSASKPKIPFALALVLTALFTATISFWICGGPGGQQGQGSGFVNPQAVGANKGGADQAAPTAPPASPPPPPPPNTSPLPSETTTPTSVNTPAPTPPPASQVPSTDASAVKRAPFKRSPKMFENPVLFPEKPEATLDGWKPSYHCPALGTGVAAKLGVDIYTKRRKPISMCKDPQLAPVQGESWGNCRVPLPHGYKNPPPRPTRADKFYLASMNEDVETFSGRKKWWHPSGEYGVYTHDTDVTGPWLMRDYINWDRTRLIIDFGAGISGLDDNFQRADIDIDYVGTNLPWNYDKAGWGDPSVQGAGHAIHRPPRARENAIMMSRGVMGIFHKWVKDARKEPMYRVPLLDNSVDLIRTHWGMAFMTDDDMSEVDRILRPGGVLRLHTSVGATGQWLEDSGWKTLLAFPRTHVKGPEDTKVHNFKDSNGEIVFPGPWSLKDRALGYFQKPLRKPGDSPPGRIPFCPANRKFVSRVPSEPACLAVVNGDGKEPEPWTTRRQQIPSSIPPTETRDAWKKRVEYIAKAIPLAGKNVTNILDVGARGAMGFAAAQYDVAVRYYIKTLGVTTPTAPENRGALDRGFMTLTHIFSEGALPNDARVYDVVLFTMPTSVAGTAEAFESPDVMRRTIIELDRLLRPGGYIVYFDDLPATLAQEWRAAATDLLWYPMCGPTGDLPDVPMIFWQKP